MTRKICFDNSGWEDYLYWQKQDKKTLKRINKLIDSALRDPFKGLGDPEPLKANLSGFCSRRIDHKNRLVYGVFPDSIVIIQCLFHYSDK